MGLSVPNFVSVVGECGKLYMLQVGFVCRMTNTYPGVYMGFIRQ